MDQNQPANVPTVSDEELRLPQREPVARHHVALNMVIISLLVIILLALAIGLFLWGRTISEPLPEIMNERPTAEENNEPESTTAEAQAETTEAVSTSHDLEAISTDIEATTMNDFESDYAAIEAELQ